LIVEVKKADPQYKTNELCELFQLSVSTHYYHLNQEVSDSEQFMINKIKEIATEHRHAYGKRRMKKELNNKGLSIGVYKTASLMKKANVAAIRPKKRPRYDKDETHSIADNLLKRQFNPSTLHTHWVGDITYIKTHTGWSYLACVLDLGSREIVGWALSQSPDAALAKAALHNAIEKQQPEAEKLQFHSDQGVQYSAHKFVDYLKDLTITQSMSRRGNCWDNAVMERFFRSLKTERLNYLSFINHQSVVTIVESYIRYYNYKRLHSSLDYETPHQRSQKMKKAA
jgi:transposase InsO family protein